MWEGSAVFDGTYEYARRSTRACERIVVVGLGGRCRGGRGLSLVESAWRLRDGLAGERAGRLVELCLCVFVGPDAFDLCDKVGGFVTEVAVFPSASVADAALSTFKDDGARGAEACTFRGLDAVLEQLATVLAVDAVCDAVLLPGGAIDEAEASLCKIFVADFGESGVVLALEEVPPLFLSGAGAEVKVFAGAYGVERILDAELLHVSGTLLLAVLADGAVPVLALVIVGCTDVGHGEAGLCVYAVQDLVEGGLACQGVRTSRHDGEGDVDSLHAGGIVVFGGGAG